MLNLINLAKVGDYHRVSHVQAIVIYILHLFCNHGLLYQQGF